MKRFLASLALGVGLSSFLMVTGASAQAPTPPEIAARNFILLDLTTQQTLAERDADTPQDPASLTKLMTAYIVFDALKAKRLTLEQTLTVSKRAWEERKGDCAGRDGQRLCRPVADVHRHDDDAEGRRADPRHDHPVGQ